MERLTKAQKIFEHAITLKNPAADQFMKSSCGDDQQLLDLVQTLFDSHQSLPEIRQAEIESHIIKLLATTSTDNGLTDKVQPIAFSNARYQFIKKIKTGGMGSVYLCQRDHDGYKQKVAIKILEGFENNPTLLDRFTQEKHILAQLSHPNITQFIDTDYLTDGTPFVVMEYTPGDTITQYCQLNKLNITQCLKLFLKLCNAVQYAHQNLIIHRDIKPSNVLVTENEKVKLLDFGIAKFIEDEGLFRTQTGHHAMTFAYASPEQIMKKPLNVTTDVYSLGVVLYEIITSQRPFDAHHFSLAEYEKKLLLSEPKLPSQIAKTYQSTLKGDVDAITLKCIQSDKNLRYQTVSELIADINNYLSDKPVKAQKPGLIYRGIKFLKRNSIAVSAITAVSCMVIFFVLRIQAEKQLAQKARMRSEAINQNFIRAFENADPTKSLGLDLKASHILDESLKIIKKNTWNDPETQSNLLVTMAEVFHNLGAYQNAEESISLIEPYLNLLTPKNHTKITLIKAQVLIKNEKYNEGITLLKQLAPTTNIVNEKNLILAQAHLYEGNINQAKIIMDDISAQVKTDDPLFFKTCLLTGSLLGLIGKNKKQSIYIKGCLDRASSNDALNLWDKSLASIQLAKSFQGRKQYTESNRFFQSALDDRIKDLGDNHISLMVIYKGLGWNLMELKEFEGSLNYQQKALSIANKYFGENTPKTTNFIYNLANLYDEMGDYQQAIILYQKSIDIMNSNGMNEAIKLAFYYKAMGVCLYKQNKLEGAINSFKNSIKIFSLKQGTYIYRVAEVQVLLSEVYHQLGKNESTRALLSEAMPLMYTMHKEGDYIQELGENLADRLNVKYKISNKVKETGLK